MEKLEISYQDYVQAVRDLILDNNLGNYNAKIVLNVNIGEIRYTTYKFPGEIVLDNGDNLGYFNFDSKPEYTPEELEELANDFAEFLNQSYEKRGSKQRVIDIVKKYF